MRLIDADALKTDISTEWLTAQTKQAFYKIIDNAPTVEERIDPNDICYLCDRKKCGENHNCYECNHTTDIRHAVNFDLVDFPRSIFFERARPHGKWEEDWREDLDFMSRKGGKCPFCNWRTTYGTPNFCMNCGADLREDSEK